MPDAFHDDIIHRRAGTRESRSRTRRRAVRRDNSRKIELGPEFVDGRGQSLQVILRVERTRGDANAFSTNRDCRVVYGLEIELVLVEKRIRKRFALPRIPNHDRQNVRLRVHHRESLRLKHTCQLLNPHFLQISFHGRILKVSHGGSCCGANMRRRRGCEDES